MNVLLLLDPLLHVCANLLRLALEVGSRLVLEYTIAVSQLHSVVFVLLDASLGLILHLSKEVDCFCSGDISLLARLESWQLVVQLENSTLHKLVTSILH